MLKVWNMVLVALAFELSLFGTFLTRSGRRQLDPLVLEELDRRLVPRSSSSSRSRLLGGADPTWRLPLLRAKTKLESLVSREATFLYNNLLLVALCLTILWGVVFPLLTRGLCRGESRTIGRSPTSTSSCTAFGLPLLLLMGIGPLSPGGAPRCARSGRRSLGPLAVARRDRRRRCSRSASAARAPGLLAYTFSAFVAATIVLEFVRGRGAPASRARVAAGVRDARRAQPAPLRRLRRPRVDRAARDRHRRLERVPDDRASGKLQPGQSVAGRPATRSPTAGSTQSKSANAHESARRLDVTRGGSHVADAQYRENNYPIERHLANEVGDLSRTGYAPATST